MKENIIQSEDLHLFLAEVHQCSALVWNVTSLTYQFLATVRTGYESFLMYE